MISSPCGRRVISCRKNVGTSIVIFIQLRLYSNNRVLSTELEHGGREEASYQNPNDNNMLYVTKNLFRVAARNKNIINTVSKLTRG